MKKKSNPLPATAQDEILDRSSTLPLEMTDVDEAEFLRIKATYEYPIRLMHKFIVDFFKVLERKKHYIYTTILHLSETDFRINRTYDWKLNGGNYNKKDGCITPETYSLQSFNAMRKAFHRYDEFEIFVFSECFSQDDVMTLEKVERLYLRYLREKCKTELRKDKQIQLTPEIIKKYEFTADDVTIVRKYLNQYNFESRNKIQREYDALKDLSFIRK